MSLEEGEWAPLGAATFLGLSNIATTVLPRYSLGEVKVRLGQSQGEAGRGRGQDTGGGEGPPPLPRVGVLCSDSLIALQAASSWTPRSSPACRWEMVIFDRK